MFLQFQRIARERSMSFNMKTRGVQYQNILLCPLHHSLCLSGLHSPTNSKIQMSYCSRCGVYVCGTYCNRSCPLRRGYMVSSQGLWRVNALHDFLLDEMHGKSKLLPGQLAYLPGVCQGPVEEPGHSYTEQNHHTVEQKTPKIRQITSCKIFHSKEIKEKRSSKKAIK